jgi:hypothetical protein
MQRAYGALGIVDSRVRHLAYLTDLRRVYRYDCGYGVYTMRIEYMVSQAKRCGFHKS